MAAVEVAAAGTAPAAAPFALDVLVVVREAQLQHGLRHGDYARYMHYCNGKVRRLRAALNLQQSKGRKYVAKPVSAENATRAEALLVALFQAERDWAYAMALKADVAEAPRKRFHVVKRLRRAAQHAKNLASICEALGARSSPRTLLDAQAYWHFLDGLVHLETQHWQEALDALIQTRAILTRLADTGTPEQTAMCNARIEEVDPSIRYSAYNLGQLSGGGDEKEINELVRRRLAAAGGGSAWESLAGHLEALAVEDSKKAPALQEIAWAGQRVPLRNAKVAGLLAAVVEQQRALAPNASTADALASYDRLLSLCADAVAAAQADIKADEAATSKAKSAKSQETTAQLRLVLAYANYQRLTALAGRGLVVVAQTLGRMPGETVAATQAAPTAPATAAANAEEAKPRGAARQKPAKLEDVVHHYDQLMQNWTDVRALAGLDDDKALARAVDGRVLLYRGFRLHYCGRINEAASQWPQALAMYARSDEVIAKAAALFAAKDGAAKVEDGLATVERLTRMNRGRRAIVKADALLQAGAAAPAGSTPAGPAPGAALALEHRLQDAVEVDPADLARLRLVDLPPQFAVAPVKPVLFDIAENHVSTPSLGHRYDARSGGSSGAAGAGGITGLLSGWFGGGKK